MIWRFLSLVATAGFCFGSTADAADLPVPKVRVMRPVVIVAKPKFKLPAKPLKVGDKPAVKSVSAVPPQSPSAVAEVSPPPVESTPKVLADDASINLSWTLDPLIANADGGKAEGAASAETNLVVDKPGLPCRPSMVIKISGHVIKTPNSTVRVDVKIGKINRTLTWAVDDVHAGRFTVTLNETSPSDKLPAYLPVSAIVMVTKSGEGGAAMVSVERIEVRMGTMDMAEAQ